MNKTKNNTTDFASIEAKWNSIYKNSDFSLPAEILYKNRILLPEKGCALDLACGLGSNALFMAAQRLETHAWDISSFALKKLQQKASLKDLNVSVKQVFIEPGIFPKQKFDVIVVSRFLDRSLSNAIMESLKTHGLLFYQTYVREKLGTSGPKNADFLLARNELLTLFNPLYLVSYKENSLIGDLKCGERNEAFFIGQKR